MKALVRHTHVDDAPEQALDWLNGEGEEEGWRLAGIHRRGAPCSSRRGPRATRALRRTSLDARSQTMF